MDMYCGIDGTLNDDTTHLPALARPEMLTRYVRRIGLLGFEGSTLTVSSMSLLLIWRHRSNIVNLLAGKEGRIGEKKSPSS